MSSPKVTYSYANGSANTIRPTSVTYPDNTGGTRVLTYDYGTSGGMNDKLSRVENLGFGGTSNLVQPSYLGLGTQVRTDFTQPQVRWDLATGSSPNPYAGLDRFGRVIDNKWTNYSTSATLDQIKYTYDRASNRTSRENVVAKAQTTPQYFDELYGYDGSNRLTQMQRGQLAGSPPASITNPRFAQDWGLDPTGNWQEFSEDSNGSGTNDLVQARQSNPVNEITAINNTVGSPWVQPGYDAAGNMTTIPQGNEPEEGFTGVYDAWNRLVKLLDEDDNLVAEYAYDGLTRRIRKTTVAETRHYLYNASWQILEERVGSATTYDRQYVWGLRYIDECVLRDKSGGARLYALQDANWNVDALVDTSGSVVERFGYSAYGVPTILNPDFAVKAGSDYAWDVLYAGYKWDAESGMYQVRHRYLLPVVGTWVSRDPVNDVFDWRFRISNDFDGQYKYSQELMDLTGVLKNVEKISLFIKILNGSTRNQVALKLGSQHVSSNSYLYAESNSIIFSDPKGLFPMCFCKEPAVLPPLAPCTFPFELITRAYKGKCLDNRTKQRCNPPLIPGFPIWEIQKNLCELLGCAGFQHWFCSRQLVAKMFWITDNFP